MKLFRFNHPRFFLSIKEKRAIKKAIADAEAVTSGEIRVHLERSVSGDVLERATKCFDEIGMNQTKERNGVLIFLSLQDRRFAVIGDLGIHSKVPADFWSQVTDKMKQEFSEDRFANGIIYAIESLGKLLREYFPRSAQDRNELTDGISYN